MAGICIVKNFKTDAFFLQFKIGKGFLQGNFQVLFKIPKCIIEVEKNMGVFLFHWCTTNSTFYFTLQSFQLFSSVLSLKGFLRKDRWLFFPIFFEALVFNPFNG